VLVRRQKVPRHLAANVARNSSDCNHFCIPSEDSPAEEHSLSYPLGGAAERRLRTAGKASVTVAQTFLFVKGSGVWRPKQILISSANCRSSRARMLVPTLLVCLMFEIWPECRV
jgi:hypothetical protein